ncbi:hypothetical protein E4U19_007828 [Claviceps sp. Clav32 group G5]|nr:hypothetical protein E4U19_007828 [Claviceps sp. Clav32 group G5]KAG6040853.1 hypothetical protein E4U39_006829 [Claviceps sp. Clav50 group G5]
MKFNTVLGTFALSTLEAYRVSASPIDPVSPETQSLEARAPEYCCMRVVGYGFARSQFVPFVGGTVHVLTVNNSCKISVDQDSTPPSQGGCPGWTGHYENCERENPRVFSLPAEACQLWDKT